MKQNTLRLIYVMGKSGFPITSFQEQPLLVPVMEDPEVFAVQSFPNKGIMSYRVNIVT